MFEGGCNTRIDISESKYAPGCHTGQPGCNIMAGMHLARYVPEDGVSPMGTVNEATMACRGLRDTTAAERNYVAGLPASCLIPEQVCDMVVTYRPIAGQEID